jgi:hypothetical protein
MKAQPPYDDYFLDQYGECVLGAKCEFQRLDQWAGQLCPNWRPIAATIEDLKEKVYVTDRHKKRN